MQSIQSPNNINLYFLITHISYHERYNIYEKLLLNKQSHFIFFNGITSWKVSIFRVVLVHIFPHSDWIWKGKEYLPVFSPNEGKYGPEELWIRQVWILFCTFESSITWCSSSVVFKKFFWIVLHCGRISSYLTSYIIPSKQMCFKKLSKMMNDLPVYFSEQKWEYLCFFFCSETNPYFFISIKLIPIVICQAINYNICITGDYSYSLTFTLNRFYVLNKATITFFNWWFRFSSVIILRSLNTAQSCTPPLSVTYPLRTKGRFRFFGLLFETW